MQEHSDKKQHSHQANAHHAATKKTGPGGPLQLLANGSPQASQIRAYQEIANRKQAPVQRMLMRNPQGTQNRWGMNQDLQPGDPLTVNDFLWEAAQRQWYQFRRWKTASEIFVTLAAGGGPVLLYNMNTGLYSDVDREARAGTVAVMNQINQGAAGNPHAGVHYPFNYEHNFPNQWQPGYNQGHADPTYFQWNAPSDWTLVPGQRASVALQAWLTGLTIAECGSVLVAIQLDQVRRMLGDAEFDTKFGPANAHIAPTVQPLRICNDIGQSLPQNYLTGAGTTHTGAAALVPGAKYFFGNHSSYNYKHPDGFFQGENCVYVGQGHWSGFGVNSHTTLEMYELMRDEYNLPRTAGDYDMILATPGFHRIPAHTIAAERHQGSTSVQIYANHLNDIHPLVRTPQQGGTLPVTVTVQDLLQDGEAGITAQGIKLNVRTILNIP
jgi:hypothetical protein